jgi:hypothetical protein
MRPLAQGRERGGVAPAAPSPLVQGRERGGVAPAAPSPLVQGRERGGVAPPAPSPPPAEPAHGTESDRRSHRATLAAALDNALPRTRGNAAAAGGWGSIPE